MPMTSSSSVPGTPSQSSIEGVLTSPSVSAPTRSRQPFWSSPLVSARTV
jgi:hypothetical protein